MGMWSGRRSCLAAMPKVSGSRCQELLAEVGTIQREAQPLVALPFLFWADDDGLVVPRRGYESPVLPRTCDSHSISCCGRFERAG